MFFSLQRFLKIPGLTTWQWWGAGQVCRNGTRCIDRDRGGRAIEISRSDGGYRNSSGVDAGKGEGDVAGQSYRSGGESDRSGNGGASVVADLMRASMAYQESDGDKCL
jgi:hypothetical protein